MFMGYHSAALQQFLEAEVRSQPHTHAHTFSPSTVEQGQPMAPQPQVRGAEPKETGSCMNGHVNWSRYSTLARGLNQFPMGVRI